MALASLWVVAALSACAGDGPAEPGGLNRAANLPPVADPRLRVGPYQDFIAEAGDRVFFAYDSAELNAEAQAILDRQARWLKQNPRMNLVVEGHADERGTREYNLALGERRAQKVKDALAARGVDPARLRTISYGKERPVALGANEAAWSLNRRGVSVLSK